MDEPGGLRKLLSVSGTEAKVWKPWSGTGRLPGGTGLMDLPCCSGVGQRHLGKKFEMV